MTNNIINITFHIEIVMFDTFHHRFLRLHFRDNGGWFGNYQDGPWNILLDPFLSL